MEISPMRFKSHTWNYNPEKIKILSQKEVVESIVPLDDNITESLGRNARMVTGEGCVFGENCFEEYYSIWGVFRDNTPGVLSIPEFAVMNAYFTSLSVIGEATDNLIRYSFSFTEVMDTTREKSPKTVHIAGDGESLWDIAYKYDITVEKLLELNPEIKHPFDVDEGLEVSIC